MSSYLKELANLVSAMVAVNMDESPFTIVGTCTLRLLSGVFYPTPPRVTVQPRGARVLLGLPT